jgi:flagellar hook-associated protein 2
MELGLSGLASNFDWHSLIDQLSDIERVPQQRLLAEQNTLEERNTAYGSILTQLKVLQNRVTSLQSPGLFNARQSSVADATVATASVSTAALRGTYTFEIQQLASAARQLGVADAGRPLSDSPDVTGLSLGDAGFATPVTAGTFRVNGGEVSVLSSDTLQGVFDKIEAATGGSVTASYDSASDRIRLASSEPIVLGSATDSSNFLAVAKLHNNGTGTVESAAALGALRPSGTLADARFATALDFGATGAGAFRINGVAIEFTAADTLDDVLSRINDSAAGVTASYDSLNDRFAITNKVTGDMGIALEDVSGNFLAATGLSSGTLERGTDLLYQVNNGGTLRSRSNTIDQASSGIAGLTVNALKEGTTTVTVSSDTAGVRTAITDFIDAYNKAQSLIASETASSTDADGAVSTSTVSGDGEADAIASDLRRLAYGSVEGLATGLSHLEALGIVSNSNDDTLELADAAKLDEALAHRLNDVRELWSDASHGIATRLATYLEKTAGEDGSLSGKQDLLTRQASDIDVQIADLERLVQANRERLTESFIAMERAQATINQQMQFLLQRFGT